MQEIKNKIEAVLFTTGKFMDVEEIARLCGIGSIGIVRDALKQLIADYDRKNCSLQIFEEKGRYKLNIRKKYFHLTTTLLNDSELDVPTQETLAIIAYKQPVLQSDIIKVRGNTAYDHIKSLKEEEFITSEKYGRTRLLKVAPKFYDYFDVMEDHLQSKFKEVENKLEKAEDVQEKLKDTDIPKEKEMNTEEEKDKKKKKKESEENVEEEILEMISEDEPNDEDKTAPGNMPESSIVFD